MSATLVREPPVPTPLVGRDEECARIQRQFLDRLGVGGRGLLLVGDAGIGKTALWQWTRVRAMEDGARFLHTRGYADDQDLSYSALRDLLREEPETWNALHRAGDSASRGRALLAYLEELARTRPVVIGLDDLQWVDEPSVGVLRYAVSRLEGSPVSLVATMRWSEQSTPLRTVLLPADRIDLMQVGPLDLESTGQAIRQRVGHLSQPELLRLHQLARGNPSAMLEFVRHLRDCGLAWDEAVSYPTLASPLPANLFELDESLLELLRISALLGRVSADGLLDVVGAEGEAVLSEAVAGEWMTIHDDLTVQIRHPLLEAAVVTAMTPLERRALHARLAERVTDPDSRAWHLALGSVGPSAHHADELERAAQRAQGRGDAARAATLAMHAVRLTPAPDAGSRLRRGMYEITLRAASGEPDRALRLADALAEQLPPGPARSYVLARRCFLDVREGENLLTHELESTLDDPASAAVLHGTLGLIHGLYRADLPVGLQHALRAVELARDREDLELFSEVAVVAATLRELAGEDGEDLLREAERCWDEGHRSVLGRWPMIFRGRLSLWSGDLATAETCFTDAHRRSMTHGTCFQGPYRFHDRATVALARGDLGRALELAESGIEMARDAHNEAALAWLLHPRGLALAFTGDAGAAIRDAERLAEWGRSAHEPLRVVAAHDIRGMAALARGHAARAVSEFRAGADLVASLGFRHPGATPVQLHVVEAASAAGDEQLCHDATRVLVEAAEGSSRPWVSAAATYAEGLSQLVAGEVNEAVPALDRAAELFVTLGYGLDAARAHLALGRALTRAGRRTGAAAAFGKARAAFASAQAIPWLATVDEELARVSPERATGELTPTESRIAELVARGLRNRDIAAELFVCESTVEAHLTRIYRKLCVRSRAALTRMVVVGIDGVTVDADGELPADAGV